MTYQQLIVHRAQRLEVKCTEDLHTVFVELYLCMFVFVYVSLWYRRACSTPSLTRAGKEWTNALLTSSPGRNSDENIIIASSPGLNDSHFFLLPLPLSVNYLTSSFQRNSKNSQQFPIVHLSSPITIMLILLHHDHNLNNYDHLPGPASACGLACRTELDSSTFDQKWKRISNTKWQRISDPDLDFIRNSNDAKNLK